MALGKRAFSLFLAMTPGIGGRTLVRVLARNSLLNRTPEEFLSLSLAAKREEYGLSAKSAQALETDIETQIQSALELEKNLAGWGIELITAADAHYPARIEAMDSDPPGALFLYGNSKLLQTKTFSVLSSRKSPKAAVDDIERLTEEGVLAGETLVTGHDRPEYQRAAVVPLRWGAPRILCLDRGHFEALGPQLKDEPFRAARLWRYEFDPRTDLVISPFRPKAIYRGVNNQVRDRLIADLSDRIDFPFLEPGHNMDKLCRSALKAGRAVRISDRIIGYRALLALGATTIEPTQ